MNNDKYTNRSLFDLLMEYALSDTPKPPRSIFSLFWAMRRKQTGIVESRISHATWDGTVKFLEERGFFYSMGEFYGDFVDENPTVMVSVPALDTALIRSIT